LPWSRGSLIYNYLCNQCLSPLMMWVRISIRARCTTLCDKVCQWLATSRWFSAGPPVSSLNKTDRHDIAEILLKVALNTIKQTNKQTNKQQTKWCFTDWKHNKIANSFIFKFDTIWFCFNWYFFFKYILFMYLTFVFNYLISRIRNSTEMTIKYNLHFSINNYIK